MCYHFFLYFLTFLLDKQSASEDEREEDYPTQVINTGIGELPPGAEISDSDDYDMIDANDPHRALNIDLDMPLREDERLPVLEHRVVENSPNKKVTEVKTIKKDKVIISFFSLLYNVDGDIRVRLITYDERRREKIYISYLY